MYTIDAKQGLAGTGHLFVIRLLDGGPRPYVEVLAVESSFRLHSNCILSDATCPPTDFKRMT